jgi:hypothetical protein
MITAQTSIWSKDPQQPLFMPLEMQNDWFMHYLTSNNW